MRRRHLALTAAVAAATMALAACGSDDDGGSSEEDAEITEAIEQAATSDSVERCTEYQTAAFTEQTEFASGEQAVEACEQGADDGQVAGESVEVDNIEVDGDSAAADVSFVGGTLDNQQIAISLVMEGGQWKLDSLDEFLAFDKPAFASALVAGAGAGGDVPQRVLDCVEKAVNDASDEEVQSAYLSGDDAELVGIFGPCLN